MKELALVHCPKMNHHLQQQWQSVIVRILVMTAAATTSVVVKLEKAEIQK